MVKVFIVDMRQNGQRRLKESRGEREREREKKRSRLDMSRAGEVSENSGDSQPAG